MERRLVWLCVPPPALLISSGNPWRAGGRPFLATQSGWRTIAPERRGKAGEIKGNSQSIRLKRDGRSQDPSTVSNLQGAEILIRGTFPCGTADYYHRSFITNFEVEQEEGRRRERGGDGAGQEEDWVRLE